MVLRIIPSSINAVYQGKRAVDGKIVLNSALAESEISTMMSQVRYQFIYNTLGSIEQLCKFDR
jgi:hypothetical protein